MTQETGAVPVTSRELKDLLVQVKRRPPDLKPVGQCPYCHHDLEKREVNLPAIVFQSVQTFNKSLATLLTFWACTNEGCCLMFWRHPQAPQQRVFPTMGDGIEH